jgi:cytochrome c biogenesis protein
MGESASRVPVPKQTVGQRFWKLFSSPRLAIFLMMVLAGISILGTLVPQGREPQFYVQEFGPAKAWWILSLGLANLYHTWWFLTVMLFLSLNIFVCFYNRFPQKFKAFASHRVNPGRPYLLKQRNRATLSTHSDLEEAALAVDRVLRRRRYRVLKEHGGGSIAIHGTKGRLGRFGSDITHVAFLIIIGGAIIGNLFGFKDFIAIFEGDVKYVEQGGFYVRLDDFEVEFYPGSARPKDYKSTLTVIEGGQEKLTKVIEVNDPLVYKGIWFYQSSYGEAWRKIKEATFQVFDRRTGKLLGQYRLPFGREFVIPKNGLTLKMVDFVADFSYDTIRRRIYSKSAKHANPAVLVEIYENGRLTSRPWIFLRFPDAHAFQLRDSSVLLRLIGYEGVPYTGLKVSRDPGVNIVWTGCFLLTVGLFLSFFVFHKRVWVRLEPQAGGTTEVVMGATTNKNALAFEKEFQTMLREIRSALGGLEDRAP